MSFKKSEKILSYIHPGSFVTNPIHTILSTMIFQDNLKIYKLISHRSNLKHCFVMRQFVRFFRMNCLTKKARWSNLKTAI